MAPEKNVEALRRQMDSNMVKSESGRYFIQKSMVQKIFAQEQIEAALAELSFDVHERLGLAEKIQHEGKIVFAILIWMRMPQCIIKFRSHGCLDTKLPLQETDVQKIAPELGASFAREEQWRFLPFLFEKDMCENHRRIRAETILPFVGEPKPIPGGGFSEVSELKMPAALQEFIHSADDNVAVIRKKVKRTSQTPEDHDEVFKDEMKILIVLNALRHPNIIPLWASYTYNNEHNFLFPCFEMGLRGFFRQDKRLEEFQEDFAFYLALYGLASALEHTHNLHLEANKHGLDWNAIGCHNDLRPANILIGNGTLILADFGLGKLKPAEIGSNSLWKNGEGDYVAPECMDSSFTPQRVGRPIDVWAFGCLLVEVITYMKQGPKGLEKFRESRTNEDSSPWKTACFHNLGYKLKASVHHQLEELGSNSTRASKQMLKIALKALETVPEKRPCISQIRRDLTIPVLRELHSAVLGSFVTYEHIVEQQARLPMSLWFIGELIRAFAGALPLDDDIKPHILREYESYTRFCNVMTKLFRRIEFELNSIDKGDPSTQKLGGPRRSFEWEMHTLTEELWGLLPIDDRRRASAFWFKSMQKNETDYLKKFDKYLQSHQWADVAEVGARAHMRAILLQKKNNPTAGAPEFFRPRKDLENLETLNGHTFGIFQKQQRVLVEWMYYLPERYNAIPEQRAILMRFKASDFDVDPKPIGLRTLKCLGFVEQIEEQGRSYDYAFLYQLPPQPSNEKFIPPITLRQLISSNGDYSKQPPLLARFKIGHSLALFFEEFYNLECVHENFNSNNVIFAQSLSEMIGSTKFWSQPYVVGFQKMRPVGQDWGTEGPVDIPNLRKYELHPDYRKGGRFLLEYDYYSLGLVLLQIGSWTPLEIWLKKYGSETPEQFRELLKDKYVPRLASTVGEVYRDIVRACLDGTLERNKDLTTSKDLDRVVFNKFTEKVAKPLEELSRLRI